MEPEITGTVNARRIDVTPLAFWRRETCRRLFSSVHLTALQKSPSDARFHDSFDSQYDSKLQAMRIERYSLNAAAILLNRRGK